MSEENVQETTEAVEQETTQSTAEKTTSKLEELEKDDLISIVRDLRKENAKTRTEKQATKAELEEFQKWKESQKTELEKAQERATELEKKTYSLLKESIALKAGLSPDDVDFIHGDTEDEMKASAEKLAGRLKPAEGEAKKTVTDVFAGARGTPVPAGPKDTKTLANQWLAGIVFKD